VSSCYAHFGVQAAFTVDKEGLLPMHYASDRDDRNLDLEVVQYILQTNPKGRVGTVEPVAEQPRDSPRESNKSQGFFSKAVSLFSQKNGPGGVVAASSEGRGPVRRKSVMQKR
jgi:hypothetical protein